MSFRFVFQHNALIVGMSWSDPDIDDGNFLTIHLLVISIDIGKFE